MAYNPIHDWVAGKDHEPGPEEQVVRPPWERMGDDKKSDAHHGRGYVTDAEKDKRDSDVGVMEALAVALFGAWIVLPVLKIVWKWTFYLIVIVSFLFWVY